MIQTRVRILPFSTLVFESNCRIIPSNPCIKIEGIRKGNKEKDDGKGEKGVLRRKTANMKIRMHKRWNRKENSYFFLPVCIPCTCVSNEFAFTLLLISVCML